MVATMAYVTGPTWSRSGSNSESCNLDFC